MYLNGSPVQPKHFRGTHHRNIMYLHRTSRRAGVCRIFGVSVDSVFVETTVRKGRFLGSADSCWDRYGFVSRFFMIIVSVRNYIEET